MSGRKKSSGESWLEERWRVRLPQAVWLLERMAAHDDPITGEQVERFGRNPDGPILPDACLESRRLPDGWGAHDNGYQEAHAAATSIAVRADGVLAIAGVVRGVATVFVGDERYEYGRESGVLMYASPEIVGFDRDGLPVVRVSYSTVHAMDAGLDWPPGHFRGRTKLDDPEHRWYI